jgi:prevent-host-death family protein
MTVRIGVAEAKATLSAVIERVARTAERVVIERRGRPVAAVVSLAELSRLDELGTPRPSADAAGALALVGLWEDVDDAELDAFVADIRASRDNDLGRPVDLEP